MKPIFSKAVVMVAAIEAWSRATDNVQLQPDVRAAMFAVFKRRMMTALNEMDDRVWALYSEDDGVVLFDKYREALKTKAIWRKAGANGIEGPLGPFSGSLATADTRKGA